MNNPITFAAHDFTIGDWDNRKMPFDPADYSRLKFGCDVTARAFGHTVADRLFARYGDMLLNNRAVVLPSAYNYVPNAAMVMTQHFLNRLNHLLADAGGQPVEFSLVRRKLTFTTDYGFLSKEERQKILTNDQMYINDRFLEGKLLIFIDDVRITGTNEHCMEDVLSQYAGLTDNPLMFVYFARFVGDGRPDVEASLNFSGIKTLAEYAELARHPDHHVIVRPIKFLLGQRHEDFVAFLGTISTRKAEEIYYGALGEGYYSVDDFQDNFLALKARVEGRTVEPLFAAA